MAIIVHENMQERLDDYLERRLRNYEVITPPIPKKPEIVTEDDHRKRSIQRRTVSISGPFNVDLDKRIIKSSVVKLP